MREAGMSVAPAEDVLGKKEEPVLLLGSSLSFEHEAEGSIHFA